MSRAKKGFYADDGRRRREGSFVADDSGRDREGTDPVLLDLVYKMLVCSTEKKRDAVRPFFALNF